MTYTGEVHNGVVVLKDAPILEEGTQVRVEVESMPAKLRRGSPEAVLAALKDSRGWMDSADEMDEALEYLRRTKLDEARAQLEKADDEL
jgi:hypothetical protein